MKYCKYLCFLSLLLVSCNYNQLVIDEVTQISVFEDLKNNSQLCTDIINNDWQDILKNSIENFEKSDLENLKFFNNVRQDDNKVFLQLRYPKNKKPKNYNKIRYTLKNQQNCYL